jgi:hypothetical protein
MAIRLWLTILVGSLAALAGLQVAQIPLGLEWTFALAAPVFVVVFYVLGWLFNRLGVSLVERLINEAAIWERAGKTSQAEKMLRKAVAVFDSFLVSPFNKERRARRLAGHMARFYLTQANLSPEAEDTILTYLKMRPEDQAVAEAWLQRLQSRDQGPKKYEDLLFSLAKTQRDNPTVQTLIARRYLSAGRADFQALQTYRRLMKNIATMDERMIIQIAELFFDKRRMEPWATIIYLKAYKLDRKKRHLLHGIAACLQGTQATHEDSATFEEARELLAGIDETSLMKMIAEFKPLAPASEKPDIPPKASIVTAFIAATLSATRKLITSITTAKALSAEVLTATYRRIRAYHRLKSIIRWTAVGLAGAGIAILVINTATHLMQTKSEPEEIKALPVAVITDPYTLQVAAYLKIEHAQKYVAQLINLDLDAYWTKAQGSKRKWYQVRLSHFADKASARAYGDALKAKGIIDDFYVANYQRP